MEEAEVEPFLSFGHQQEQASSLHWLASARYMT